MGILVLGGAAACGTTSPPKELADARTAFDQAQKGVASQYDPTGVHEAEVALQTAEKRFHESGDSDETRDLSYVALRRAQIADARAQAVRSMQQVELTSAEIEKAREQQLEHAQAEMQHQEEQIEQERARREEAEKRAQQMSQELERIATVKYGPRGTVITMPGKVLFASGKTALLAGSQSLLDRIVDSLMKAEPDTVILVQGYTDASGSDTKNQEMTEKRAGAVRDYLVSKGVNADRIRAQGMGSSGPIGDNATTDGRALNRRVEIVLQTPSDQQEPQQLQPPEQPPEQPQMQPETQPHQPKQEPPDQQRLHRPKPKP
jgi:outer membrane protein OmpA-like peptidoglycan-associated protein